jgi:hypothetical protein
MMVAVTMTATKILSETLARLRTFILLFNDRTMANIFANSAKRRESLRFGRTGGVSNFRKHLNKFHPAHYCRNDPNQTKLEHHGIAANAPFPVQE